MSANCCLRYGSPMEPDAMGFGSVLESSSTISTFYTSSIKLVESIL